MMNSNFVLQTSHPLIQSEQTYVLDRKLISYLGGEAVIEKRSILKIHLFKDNSKKEFFALNDFVIARGSKVRIIDVEASLNSNHFATYRGDGVVVSTATGSTAY